MMVAIYPERFKLLPIIINNESLSMKNRKPTPKKTSNSYYLFGTHAVLGVLENTPERGKRLLVVKGNKHEYAVDLAKAAKMPVEYGDRAWLEKKLAPGLAHQGLVLDAEPYPYTTFEAAVPTKKGCCLVLDGITDPRNFGRCIRSAYAFGADFIVIPKDRAAQVSPEAEKSAVGSAPNIPIVQVTNVAQTLDKLKKFGYWVVGTTEHAPENLADHTFSEPTAIVIGNEEKGMRPLVEKGCDALVKIPMAQPISLNAADAATVVLYAARASLPICIH